MYVSTPDRALGALVDVEAACLAATLRARLAEAGRNRDGRTANVSVDDLELVPLADGALVDVAREDELGPRVDEPGEDVRAPRDRLFRDRQGAPIRW